MRYSVIAAAVSASVIPEVEWGTYILEYYRCNIYLYLIKRTDTGSTSAELVHCIRLGTEETVD